MIDPVTTRYADALYNLASRAGRLESVMADVERIGTILDSPGVLEFTFDARVSAETRSEKLRSGLGPMDELTVSLVGLLFDKRREEVLRGLAPAVHRRSLVEGGQGEGTVESARPLDSDEIEQVSKALGDRLGLEVTLENRIEPDLIGGVRAVVGNRMLDCSLRGRLEGLRKCMNEAPLAGAKDQDA